MRLGHAVLPSRRRTPACQRTRRRDCARPRAIERTPVAKNGKP
jgi:hypothetical protein